MQVFFGEYTCPLDEKHRAVLPLKLRDSIEADLLQREGFMIVKGLEGCLMMFPRAIWRKYAENAQAIPFADPKGRLFKRFFISSAKEAFPDRIGRLTIADFQRETAGIEKEVVFNGSGDYIEIWEPARWKKYQEENEGRYGEVAEAILAMLRDGPSPAPAALPASGPGLAAGDGK